MQTEGDIETMTRLGCAGEAYTEIVGPMRNRGGHNGLIVRGGRIVAEWGDTARIDMGFSVTKSFLSVIAGLAWRKGLIPDLNAPVRHSVDELFEEGENRHITWEHVLRQTSAWEGVLWDKPAWAVNRERVAARATRPPGIAPGSAFEYNDVRVNLLAFCLLQVWRRPLPQVLREAVMDKIGASPAWRWHGYRNSWVTLDGLQMQSVSGGGHWDGGMWISTRDLALWGLLVHRKGQWRGEAVLAPEWLEREITPGPASPAYGFVNWNLNTARQKLPSAPESAFYTTGSTSGDGGVTARNSVYIDRENDLLVALRWMNGDPLDSVIGQVLAALRQSRLGSAHPSAGD
jgi:CubicO group peptidase (beta-lactamase class C family)